LRRSAGEIITCLLLDYRLSLPSGPACFVVCLSQAHRDIKEFPGNPWSAWDRQKGAGMFRLKQEDYHKAAGLVKSRNELSVFSVISGIMPGIVYANDEDDPAAALVITGECNYLAGTTSDKKFNSSIRDIAEVGFWDPLTHDTDEWAEIIPEVLRMPAVFVCPSAGTNSMIIS